MKRLLFLLPLTAMAIALPVSGSASSMTGPTIRDDDGQPLDPAIERAMRSTVELSFTKHAVSDNLYLGTIDGGGAIEMMILDRRFTSTQEYLSAIFRVTVGDTWFAAKLEGTLDFATLQTHLRGRVSEGNWLRGAKVREEGQLVSDNPYTFTGTLLLSFKQDD